jgi:hypothetical protein
MLPEEILLEMFAFYVFGSDSNWQTLVHVCRRWRSIVFAAPRRLDLKLLCTSRTPARTTLDIWPALPIIVWVHGEDDRINDNVLAALEKRDRIFEVDVDQVWGGEIKELAEAMQVTFPALTHLDIYSAIDTASFPESVLGGSAPKLRSLRLVDIAFPALPNLLLSCPGLVSLSLVHIPYSEHIFAAMVDSFFSLTRLEHLQIEVSLSQPRPDGASRRLPTLTHIPVVFPILNKLILNGEMEYLDQLLAHIEAPHLNDTRLVFFDSRSLESMHITFPALPRLLLASPGLVRLSLFDIPGPAYISSNEMVECLSLLTRLEHLLIEVKPSMCRHDGASRRPPTLSPTIFPVLNTLILKGEMGYIDQLLAHIEVPHLSDAHIKFVVPRLLSLRSKHITFPALPKFFLSSPGLVSLSLFNIPCPGYISSDAMADCLSLLTRLEQLDIVFSYSIPCPDGASPRPTPLTCSVFPVLRKLLLRGVTDYFYQLLAHIEAPVLDDVCIDFSFYDLVIFDISRIFPCIGRTETFEAFDQAWMCFRDHDLDIMLSSRKGTTGGKTHIFKLSLRWKSPSWNLRTLGLRAPSSPPISFFEDEEYSPYWINNVGITPWLEFLRVFTTVENLYLCTGLVPFIAPALQELVSEGVLPALQTIFIERSQASEVEAEIIQEFVEKFVAARGPSDYPAVVLR